jgi:uncharacterized membrane protein YfcA
MLIMELHYLISPTLGLIVGLLMGLTGAGGGILSVPFLVIGLGLTIVEASPIAMVTIAISASLGAIIGLRKKILRYKAALLMASFGLILSPFGIWLAHQLPNQPLSLLFSLVLMIVSSRLFIQARNDLLGKKSYERVAPPCQLDQSIGKLIWTVPCARYLMFSGSVAGFLSGLLGVGGGFILVPALRKFTDLPVQSIVATSLGVLAIISTGNAVLATAYGIMSWGLALPFIGGSVIGLICGKLLETKISGPRILQIFAIFTFGVALSMFYQTFSS